jgi:4-aminobutyrate aminotransferase-like enzyme
MEPPPGGPPPPRARLPGSITPQRRRCGGPAVDGASHEHPSSSPNSLAARDIAYTVHPYTNLRQHERQGPLVVAGGEGVWVWDDDGKRYIEGLAGLWCTSLGFSEKRLVEAARRQMERLPYTQVFSHRSASR